MIAASVPGYVVEELLGRGGSGEVWRARVASTGDRVALKRLPVDGAEQLRAARAEAAMLATLDHPNLIRLHEVVSQPDALILVLDLAAGGSLADLVRTRGRLTTGEVIATVSPIGAALAYAHQAGVVHGDVTPANLLFTDFGLPLLADLGVARILGDTAPARSTPSCVDPILVAGGLPGPHTDVFMLAAVAVHALTGSALWRGDTPDEVLAAAARGDHDAGGRLAAAGVPAAIRDVLETALRHDPAARATAAEFALELRHAGEPVAVELSAGRAWPVPGDARPDFDRPALTRGVRARPVAPRPIPRPLWRRAACRWVAAGVAASAAIAAGWLWRPSPDRGVPAVAAAASAPATRPAVPAPVVALAALDTKRAQAFANRDPRLLADVYVPGRLRDADAALLRRLVPAGCGLVGAHTRYRDVALAQRTAERVVVTATATLAESTLVCRNRIIAHARGAGPRRMRIQLVRRGDEYRVAELRLD